MALFAQLGGPLAATFLDCSQEDAGAPIELNDQAFTRGDVVQIGKPGLAEITGGYASPDGPFGHAGLVSTVNSEVDTTGWFGVVTSESVAEDQEGRVCVSGICRVKVRMGVGETIAVGDELFVNKGAEELEPVAPTNGRAVAIALEPIGDQGGNVTVSILAIFNGLPTALGGS